MKLWPNIMINFPDVRRRWLQWKRSFTVWRVENFGARGWRVWGESAQNAKNTSKRTFNSPRAVRPSKASSFSSSFLYDDQSLSSLACVPLLKWIVCNFILAAYLNTSPMGDFDGLGLIANTEKKQLYLNKNRLKNWCMTACWCNTDYVERLRHIYEYRFNPCFSCAISCYSICVK